MSKGELKYVYGDVTNPQRSSDNEVVVIPHCCNNGTDKRGIGVMGGGVALALRNKWDQVYKIYKFMEQQFPDGLKNRLGENGYAEIIDDSNKIIVVNMIAQNMLMSNDNPKPIKYSALIRCMENIASYIEDIKFQTDHPVVIHCPEFGGLRAGGNFEFVLELIREIWLENDIDVVIYKFEEK